MSFNSPVIYLNNAATSWPKAPKVSDAIQNQLLDPFAALSSRGSFISSDPIAKVRKIIANVYHINNPNQVILTANATMSLNIVLRGLIKNNYNVLTSRAEHNSVLRPLYHLQNEKENVKIDICETDECGKILTTQMLQKLSTKIDLLVISHASNVTGSINDVSEIFAKAHQNETLTVLDASQTSGHIDVDINELNADVIVFTGHKGMLGPQGTGGFVLANENIEMDSYFVGGTGVLSDLQFHPTSLPMKYEAGTPNTLAFSGLNTALEWLTFNQKSHHSQALEITTHMVNELKKVKGINILNSENIKMPIISMIFDNWSVEEAGYILENSFGIICRTGLHCAPLIHRNIHTSPKGTLRISPSGFTTSNEIELVIEAIRRLGS